MQCPTGILQIVNGGVLFLTLWSLRIFSSYVSIHTLALWARPTLTNSLADLHTILCILHTCTHKSSTVSIRERYRFSCVHVCSMHTIVCSIPANLWQCQIGTKFNKKLGSSKSSAYAPTEGQVSSGHVYSCSGNAMLQFLGCWVICPCQMPHI